MSQSEGAVLFAFNNERYDYLSLASTSAKLIKRFLNLPTTVITNTSVKNSNFDNVIVVDSPEKQNREFISAEGVVQATWYNKSRYKVYEMSPYDKTLLLDSDYIVQSTYLRKLFDTTLPFACYNTATDVTTQLLLDEKINPLNLCSLPMNWATVLYFTKSAEAEALFSMIKLVQENYYYYATRFGFRSPRIYRNDFALSVATQLLSGYSQTNEYFIPGTIMSVTPTTDVCYKNGSFFFSTQNKLASTIRNVDLHIMNKEILTEKLLADISE